MPKLKMQSNYYYGRYSITIVQAKDEVVYHPSYRWGCLKSKTFIFTSSRSPHGIKDLTHFQVATMQQHCLSSSTTIETKITNWPLGICQDTTQYHTCKSEPFPSFLAFTEPRNKKIKPLMHSLCMGHGQVKLPLQLSNLNKSCLVQTLFSVAKNQCGLFKIPKTRNCNRLFKF